MALLRNDCPNRPNYGSWWVPINPDDRASSDAVVIAGYEQLVMRGRDGSDLAPVVGAPAGDYTPSVVRQGVVA
jgi:hypothetical protein